MIPLEDSEEILDFDSFSKNYPDLDGFRMWCNGQDLCDLLTLRDVLEKREMYEYCIVIQVYIDSRVDSYLEGFGIE